MDHMIINIRGTSGSGKTWAVRQVMDRIGSWQAIYKDGRKKPLYYRSCSEWPDTLILGHYESPCGGCDTIGSAGAVYTLITELLHTHVKDFGGRFFFPNIICEGLLLSEDTKWTGQLAQDASNPVHTLFLTTPLDKCFYQIGTRRASVGNEKPLNPENTQNRVKTIERARQKLVEMGVSCRRCSAQQAPNLILNLLRH